MKSLMSSGVSSIVYQQTVFSTTQAEFRCIHLQNKFSVLTLEDDGGQVENHVFIGTKSIIKKEQI